MTHRLLSALHEELAHLDLSAAETNVLASLAGPGSRSVREVGRATAQRPSTLTGVLDRLQARGLVDRRPNPADRRSTLIVLSAAGHDVARQVAEAFERVAARIPDDTAAEAQRLLRVLDEVLGQRLGSRTGAGRRPAG